MSEEMRRIFDERLARYQAAIALEPTDRMIVGGSASNYFAEIYAGYSLQEIMYEGSKWIAAMSRFAEDFPQVDVLQYTIKKVWPPIFESVGYKLYKLPGRELPPNIEFQFVEEEWMKVDDYDLLINNRVQFMMERFLPRVLGEFKERGSTRSYIAFLKGGIGVMMMRQVMREWSQHMVGKYGLPVPVQGTIYAPFDVLADKLRGLNGIMIDIFERPDKVLEACDALIPDIADYAFAAADPQRRIPIFLPLHRGCHPFLSPKQFDSFYWPSLKKLLMKLIEAGYTVRAYLEGDWTPNWHHYNELPKGKLLCDIEKGDIYQAKNDIGKTVCLAGGIPDSMFILGSPDQIRSRVKELCQTVGKDGGLLVTGACGIPYGTKPKNFQAYVEATLEYGRYSDGIKPELKPAPAVISQSKSAVITPWEVRLKELPEIMGDENLLKQSWELLEEQAYRWLLFWAW